MPHPYPDALDHLTPEEVVRLLDRRPDGATAAMMLQTLMRMADMDIERVELRDDERAVAFAIRVTHYDDDGRWAAVVPATVTATLCPCTRKDLSYRCTLASEDEVYHIVAAEGFMWAEPRQEHNQ